MQRNVKVLFEDGVAREADLLIHEKVWIEIDFYGHHAGAGPQKVTEDIQHRRASPACAKVVAVASVDPDTVDGLPINSLQTWLWTQAVSIPAADARMQERSVDTNELKRKIAAGEYRVDARAIAEAMFGRADRDAAAGLRPSQVLESRHGCRPSRCVE